MSQNKEYRWSNGVIIRPDLTPLKDLAEVKDELNKLLGELFDRNKSDEIKDANIATLTEEVAQVRADREVKLANAERILALAKEQFAAAKLRAEKAESDLALRTTARFVQIRGEAKSLEVSGAQVEHLGRALAEWLRANDATNCAETDFRDAETGVRYLVTVQVAGAKTPLELRDEANAEVNRMAIRLETSNRNSVEMARENIALREDKARLDFLIGALAISDGKHPECLANLEWDDIEDGELHPRVRSAIDDARAISETAGKPNGDAADVRPSEKCPNDTDGDGDCHKCHRDGGCKNRGV